MLLGVIAAATAPVAPWAATLACRLADPFLLALIAVARWAAGLPGGSVALAGPARAAPVGVVPLGLLAVARRRRSPYLPRRPSCRPTSRGRSRDEMITADELRQVVRSLPEAEERETWGHPTFRVRDKMFAAMSDDGRQATVKATREEQAALVVRRPGDLRHPGLCRPPRLGQHPAGDRRPG